MTLALRTNGLTVRILGALGLLEIVGGALLLAGGAASAPSQYVPARVGGFPDWLAGPLRWLDLGIDQDRFQVLVIAMAIGYEAVLLSVRALPAWSVYAAVLTAHAILLAGPVLLSQDLFGYLSFARLGALHGLDPYTNAAAAAPLDAVYPFTGWHDVHSPYGPLFTLLSYALVPLGVAGGVWALKTLAVSASLGAVALVAQAAERTGRSPAAAAAFVGLNPVLLISAVGGFHNDMLLVLAFGAALALSAGAHPRLRAAVAALVAGVGVKLSAGLVLPFVLLAPRTWRARTWLAADAAAGLVLLAFIGVLGFGTHALGFVGAVREQQQLVAVHSVPAELARLVGLSGVPDWWRHLFALAFALVLAFALWRTARGADWRVAAGFSTLALLVSTAWLLPWYAIWALPLAAVSSNRRLRAATLAFCVYALLIRLPLADPWLTPGQ
ncbi:MAG TPA: glycosyltransferase 87 family protein [Solirubrobacteraceae bacterium]|nr:glycosyltransferase 87 family protein [Solirubrobacteraceae bacterium]